MSVEMLRGTRLKLRRRAGSEAQRGNAQELAAGMPDAAGTVTVDRALGRALARAGQNQIGLAVQAGNTQLQSDASLAELLEMPQDRALLCVLEGPGESLGLAALCPEMTEAVVQKMTAGTTLPGPAANRRPTRTDAAMCAALIDRILAEFEAMMAGTAESAWLSRYRYASCLEEPRTLGLLLEEGSFHILRADLDIACGVRQGGLLLAFPAQRADAPERLDSGLSAAGVGSAIAAAAEGDRKEATTPGPGGRDEASESDWRLELHQMLMQTPARLDAVLTRLKMPLRAVLNWRAGETIALPDADLWDVALCSPAASTDPGVRLASGKLGQSKGHRALRLAAPGICAGMEDMRPALPPLATGEPEQSTALPDPVGHSAASDDAGLDNPADMGTAPLSTPGPVPDPESNPVPDPAPDPVFDPELASPVAKLAEFAAAPVSLQSAQAEPQMTDLPLSPTHALSAAGE